MQKESILLVIDNMKIGGIQKNMINLLIELNDKFDLTLCVFNLSGEYLTAIPSNVKIIQPDLPYQTLGMSNAEAKKSLSIFLRRTYYYVIMKIFGNGTMYKKMLKKQRNLGEYDYAISGMQSAVAGVFFSGCNELILEKVTAKQKLAYIHCDFVLSGIDNLYNRSIYKKMDKILVPNLSNYNQMVSVFPEVEDKLYIVNNFCNYNEVKTKADIDAIQYDSSKINIVTVARISPEKGIDRAIEVFERLKKENYKFSYHVIGGGGIYEELNEYIATNNLQDSIFLHGYDSNPYRYLKNADLFLLPSRNEAAGLVIDEARSLGIPILSTKTIAAEETITTHDCGWVCENSEDGLYLTLKELLENKETIIQKMNQLKAQECNNEIPVGQFCRCLKNR